MLFKLSSCTHWPLALPFLFLKKWLRYSSHCQVYQPVTLLLLLMRFDMIWWDGEWPAFRCVIKTYCSRALRHRQKNRSCVFMCDRAASEQPLATCWGSQLHYIRNLNPPLLSPSCPCLLLYCCISYVLLTICLLFLLSSVFCPICLKIIQY